MILTTAEEVKAMRESCDCSLPQAQFLVEQEKARLLLLNIRDESLYDILDWLIERAA